jgi:hypothetical protein
MHASMLQVAADHDFWVVQKRHLQVIRVSTVLAVGISSVHFCVLSSRTYMYRRMTA